MVELVTMCNCDGMAFRSLQVHCRCCVVVVFVTVCRLVVCIRRECDRLSTQRNVHQLSDMGLKMCIVFFSFYCCSFVFSLSFTWVFPFLLSFFLLFLSFFFPFSFVRLSFVDLCRWRRCGTNIRYTKTDQRHSESQDRVRYFHHLTWHHKFEHSDDTVFFAHCYPYTYTGKDIYDL